MNHGDTIAADGDDDGMGNWIDCWKCAGDGELAYCFEEFACIDPEDGCDDCLRRCDVCKGKGGWPRPEVVV